MRAASRTHLHVPLDHGDERQEQRAVEPVLVELVGRHVRGRDHHDAELEQPREQPAEDHGVGDVGDVELVEAEQPALLGDLGGGKPDRIVAGDLAVLQLLPEHAHALVHVGHELVEMRAALADHRACLEEQVHQHGLAAADVAEDVEALERSPGRSRLPNSQPSGCDAARRAMRGDALLRAPRAATSSRSCAGSRSIFLAAIESFVEFEDGHGWWFENRG